MNEYISSTVSTSVCVCQGWQEASAHLNHSVPLLERVGLPANSAMTTRSESHGNGSYHGLLHCIVGGQQVT